MPLYCLCVFCVIFKIEEIIKGLLIQLCYHRSNLAAKIKKLSNSSEFSHEIQELGTLVPT